MDELKPHHTALLEKISNEAYEKFGKKMMREREVSPTVKFVFKKMLEDDHVSDEKKEKVKNLLDSGVLDQKEEYVDPKAEKLMKAYITRKTNQAIKQGLLPARPGKHDKKGKNE
jgi:hypothetical protein